MLRKVPLGPWALALGAVLVTLFAGCEAPPPPLLRVGLNQWPGYAPLQLAEQLTYFRSKRQVRTIAYASTTQILRAFRNNSLEAAGLTLDEALLLAEDFPDIRVVLVMDSSNGGDVVLGRPGIQKLSDLRGHRVGYEATALGAFVLGRALETAGLRVSDVNLIPVQLDEHENAFKSGQVDAIVTFEPVRARLLEAGARVLFSSAEIPGEVVDVLVVRQKFLEKNPEMIADLVRGWFKALAYQAQNSDDAIRRLSAILQIAPEQTRNAYRLLSLPDLTETRRLLATYPPELRATAERLAVAMLQHQLLRRPPSLDLLFDGRVVDQVARRN